MATFTTTYVGKDATGLLSRAIANVPSFAQDGFVIDQNVKGKGNIRLVDLASTAWVDDDGEFNDQNKMTFKSKTVDLKAKKINESIKKPDVSDDWLAENMAPGATGTIGAMDALGITDEVQKVVALATDNGAWTNLITKMDADADVVDVALSTLTSANIVAELGKVVEKYAELTNNLGDERIYMHPSNRAMYNIAQAGLGVNDARGNKTQDFGGIPIVSSIAVPKNKIVMTPKSNMHFLIDLMSDTAKVSLLDQSTVTGANKINIVANASIEAEYVRGKEIVLGTAS